jgi:hypothetical protein
METGELNNPKRMDQDHSQASHPTSGHTARRRSEPQRDQNETAEHIKILNQNDPRDFFLPLDCDELVACIANEAISLQPTDIQACLLPHKAHPGPLKINGKFWHNPYRKDHYKYQLPKSKTFFARGACATLDLGFHEGCARLSQDKQDINLACIEFHSLAHKEQMEKSRAKLPHVSNFSTS